MYRIVRELLNKDNYRIPDSECPSQLANEFGDFSLGKFRKFVMKLTELVKKMLMHVILMTCHLKIVVIYSDLIHSNIYLRKVCYRLLTNVLQILQFRYFVNVVT